MADGSLFALGGIWEYWAKEGSEPLVSCAIVVTDANALMRPIHERMPLIVSAADYSRWLDTELAEAEEIAGLLAPFPAEHMLAYPISTLVNNVKNDGPDLVRPLAAGSSASA